MRRESNTEVELLPLEDVTPIIVRVKVHVKGIDIAVTLVIHNDGGGNCTVRPSLGIRSRALDPLRVFGDIVVGCEPDIAAHLVHIR